MKNIFTTILSGLALASLLVSCQKEMDTTTTAPVGDMVPVSFSANVGAITKVSLTPNGGDTEFTSAWENGDGMKLYYWNAEDDEDTVDASYDGSKWNATLPPFTGEWYYVASYPAVSAIPFGSARTQTGNAYNPAFDIMQGEVVVTNGAPGKDDGNKDIVFPMERLTAVQYFHFTSDLDEKVYSATLSVGNSDDNIAATTVNINGSGALVVASGGAKSITLTFPVGSEPTANDFKLWFNVLPSGFTSMSIDIETASHTKHIERDLSGSLGMGVYEAGKLYKVSGKITGWTTKTYSWLPGSGDFTASSTSASSKGSPEMDWDLDFTWPGGSYLAFEDNGAHIGSNANPASSVIFSTAGYSGYVENIIVAGHASGEATLQVKVGDVVLTNSGNSSATLSSTPLTEYNFVAPYRVKGDISLTYTISSKAIYVKSIVINPVPKVATPVITSDGSSFSISCATGGATIYYETSTTSLGAVSTPTTSSSVYSSAVDIAATTYVKAYAVKTGYTDSAVESATCEYGPSTTWTEVTTVAGVTAGDYVIAWVPTGNSVSTYYYLPSGTAYAKNPVAATGITVSAGTITSTVTDSMVWTFSGDNTDGFKIGDGTYFLEATNTAQGIKIVEGDDTSVVWKASLSANDTYTGLLLRANDGGTRNLAMLYNAPPSNSTWRYYSSFGSGNYYGILHLFKKTN